MTLIKTLHSLRALFLSLCLASLLTPALSWGEEEVVDSDSLDLYSGWDQTSVSASRIPKPLSQTAENTTVITASEIALLNAHTLADVLDTVSGIQVQHNGGPGIIAYTQIQSGSAFFNQVFLDGVPITNSNNWADVSAVPAQIIDRIEIIKGSASAAWGSALNGVINVITKSPEKDRPFGGSATASIGSRTTADTRVELRGTVKKLGYYLSGGYLGSDGLIPTQEINSRQIYAKLTYDLPNQGLLWSTISYSQANMGEVYAETVNFRERANRINLIASLGLRYTLAEGLELEVIGKHYNNPVKLSYFNINDGTPYHGWAPDEYRDQTSGASAKLLWRTNNNLLALGSDYNHQEAKYESFYSRHADRWGIYLNDTLTLGKINVSPGIRYDHTGTNGDQVSSSLGLTWQATDSTLLRAYTGRGYNVPLLLGANAPAQKIWTMQLGAESTAIPYLWIKGTLFRNMTWGADIEQNLAKGSELEIRTTQLFHTSLGASWTYTETTRTSDGTPARPDRPTQTVKLALRYDDSTFRGTLIGNHINWNSPDTDNGKYNGLIWDLHLGATLLQRESSSLELFFSGRNLFNGSFYTRDVFPSVGRWFEGGVRVRF